MDRKEKFTKAIILYTDNENVTDVDLYEDPEVKDTWAIRCKLDGQVVDFLVIGQELVGGTSGALMEDIAEVLEEAMFASWPPSQAPGPTRFSVRLN